jgi:hypothetical protein
MTIGATVITRNDNYGGDLIFKLYYNLSCLLSSMDEVYLVDWNSPNDISTFEILKNMLPKTGKLHHIQITQSKAKELTKQYNCTQKCVEVLARNIGIRRLRTDYKLSVNADIISLSRNSITDKIIDDRIFHVVARREMNFYHAIGCEFTPGSEEFFNAMYDKHQLFNQHGDGSPLPNDPWSLITCCGDFQLAHSNVWNAIKGYEESLVLPGYTDSNIQKKAVLNGFNIALVRDIPVFHCIHYPNTGSSGGIGDVPQNDMNVSLIDFKETTNSDSWGFASINFKEDIL